MCCSKDLIFLLQEQGGNIEQNHYICNINTKRLQRDLIIYHTTGLLHGDGTAGSTVSHHKSASEMESTALRSVEMAALRLHASFYHTLPPADDPRTARPGSRRGG